MIRDQVYKFFTLSMSNKPLRLFLLCLVLTVCGAVSSEESDECAEQLQNKTPAEALDVCPACLLNFRNTTEYKRVSVQNDTAITDWHLSCLLDCAIEHADKCVLAFTPDAISSSVGLAQAAAVSRSFETPLYPMISGLISSADRRTAILQTRNWSRYPLATEQNLSGPSGSIQKANIIPACNQSASIPYDSLLITAASVAGRPKCAFFDGLYDQAVNSAIAYLTNGLGRDVPDTRLVELILIMFENIDFYYLRKLLCAHNITFLEINKIGKYFSTFSQERRSIFNPIMNKLQAIAMRQLRIFLMSIQEYFDALLLNMDSPGFTACDDTLLACLTPSLLEAKLQYFSLYIAPFRQQARIFSTIASSISHFRQRQRERFLLSIARSMNYNSGLEWDGAGVTLILATLLELEEFEVLATITVWPRSWVKFSNDEIAYLLPRMAALFSERSSIFIQMFGILLCPKLLDSAPADNVNNLLLQASVRLDSKSDPNRPLFCRKGLGCGLNSRMKDAARLRHHEKIYAKALRLIREFCTGFTTQHPQACEYIHRAITNPTESRPSSASTLSEFHYLLLAPVIVNEWITSRPEESLGFVNSLGSVRKFLRFAFGATLDLHSFDSLLLDKIVILLNQTAAPALLDGQTIYRAILLILSRTDYSYAHFREYLDRLNGLSHPIIRRNSIGRLLTLSPRAFFKRLQREEYSLAHAWFSKSDAMGVFSMFFERDLSKVIKRAYPGISADFKIATSGVLPFFFWDSKFDGMKPKEVPLALGAFVSPLAFITTKRHSEQSRLFQVIQQLSDIIARPSNYTDTGEHLGVLLDYFLKTVEESKQPDLIYWTKFLLQKQNTQPV